MGWVTPEVSENKPALEGYHSRERRGNETVDAAAIFAHALG